MSLSRRTFIRVVGGVGVASAVPFSYAVGAEKTKHATAGVLVEAASFQNLGGWKLDTQHYLQMGGCYLLAHGMGKPVANATTKATLPEKGTWHVSVRTRNWCPGDWQAPGRFKVRVDGKLLKPEFGTEGKDWHWQAGGSVEIATAGPVEVALEDLTGFDGRCDAIYFSKDAKPDLPNGDLAALADWKDQVSGRAGKKIEEKAALEMAYKAVSQGASGVDMGRNIFQSEWPVAMIKAVREIVHKNATAEVAWEIVKEAGAKD